MARKPGGYDRDKFDRRRRWSRQAERSPGRCVVAEGDSWFSLWTRQDLIDHLALQYRMPVRCVAVPGSTLEEMAQGPERSPLTGKVVGPSRLQATVREIKRLQPAVFLLSGGGNDIAGPGLFDELIHPRSRGVGPLNLRAIERRLESLREHVTTIYNAVQRAQPELPVVVHGYANPVPDGRPAKAIAGAWVSLGPWLEPVFDAAGWTDLQQNTATMAMLIDRFNRMLQALDDQWPWFHHVDLRAAVAEDDPPAKPWKDELHLRWFGYRRAAHRMWETMGRWLS